MEYNLEQFNTIIERGVILLDFYADWCGPCRMQTPIIEQLADSYKDKIKVLKINTDQNPQIADIFQIRAIPTLVLIKDKNIVKQETGFKTLSQLQSWIDSVL